MGINVDLLNLDMLRPSSLRVNFAGMQGGKRNRQQRQQHRHQPDAACPQEYRASSSQHFRPSEATFA
ncbi:MULTISPECIES: hypothetical protein [Mameliella]|uniref:hypothetical protein n=1 Tax=Mameliella TaxID=1434019 RepID=UPI001054298B|nr:MULTISPECIES: hypothetical protein [Mameliella]